MQWSYPYRLGMEQKPLLGAAWRVPTGDVGVSPRVGHHKLQMSRPHCCGPRRQKFTSVEPASTRLMGARHDFTT